jgi:hypothetical protein
MADELDDLLGQLSSKRDSSVKCLLTQTKPFGCNSLSSDIAIFFFFFPFNYCIRLIFSVHVVASVFEGVLIWL